MKKNLLSFVVALMMTAFIATGCQKKPRVADEEVTTPEVNSAAKSQSDDQPAADQPCE